MSSVTTIIPSGVIANTGVDWCIQDLFDIFGADEPPYTYNECFNTTRGTQKSSFQTICCDGRIIDSSRNLWTVQNFSSYPLDLENLVCCRESGQRLPGGIMPIDKDYTHCSAKEIPAPLASLAATNTVNAALYLATYANAQQDGTTIRDWIRTETPQCLWVETASGVVEMTEVTVPAAQITTLPPPNTDRFGNPIVTSTQRRNYGNATTTRRTLKPAATQSTGKSRRVDRSVLLSLMGISIGLCVLCAL